DGGEDRSPLCAITVSNIGKPLRIDIGTCQQQVDSATKIHQGLNFDLPVQLRFIEMVRSFVPRLRAVPGVIWDERNPAGPGVNLGFGNEFCAGAVSPMPEEHGCERTLSVRNHQVRVHRTALGTRVSNVVKGASCELFDELVMD